MMVRYHPFLHIVFVHFQQYISFTPEQYLLGRNAKYKSYFLVFLYAFLPGVEFPLPLNHYENSY